MRDVIKLTGGLAVPPHREEMIVELIADLGGSQFTILGEIVLEGDNYVLELHNDPDIKTWRLDLRAFVELLHTSMERLRPVNPDGETDA